MHKLAFAFLLATAACGGKSSSTTTPEPPVATAPADLSTLELGDIRLVDSEKGEAVVIKADGSIEMEGKVIATVTADGKLRRNDTGEDVMMLEKDGSLKVKDGALPPIIFGADGSVTVEGDTVSIDDNGKLVGGKDAAPPLTVEGANTPGKKRTAMFVLLGLTLGGGGPDAPPGSATSPAPAPATSK